VFPRHHSDKGSNKKASSPARQIKHNVFGGYTEQVSGKPSHVPGSKKLPDGVAAREPKKHLVKLTKVVVLTSEIRNV
jgi:hypothetical protein